jgi:hypothetical protein
MSYDTSRYDEWNARRASLRLTPQEFEEWQAAIRAGEVAAQYGLKLITSKVIGQIHDELIIDADERFLGSDFDKWFLGQLKISAEGL